ncbi:hypothetical protein D3C72_2514100 [compost metagenome]
MVQAGVQHQRHLPLLGIQLEAGLRLQQRRRRPVLRARVRLDLGPDLGGVRRGLPRHGIPELAEFVVNHGQSSMHD